MARAGERRVARVPRRRSAWLQRMGPIVAVEVALAVAVLVALSAGLPPRPGWPVRYAVAAAVLVVILVLVVPMGGRSLLGRLRLRLAFARRRPRLVTDSEVPPDLVPLVEWLPGLSVSLTMSGRGDEVGVLTDGRGWTAVLAVASDDDVIAGDGGTRLDLNALSGLTVQDDIVFAGVQVVSYTVPAPSRLLVGAQSAAVRAYAELGSGRPGRSTTGKDGTRASRARVPPTVRRTWLSVRLDPKLCLEAVARRGAGNEGIHAALRFGLHRVQSVLKRQGILTRVLGPVEIYDVLALAAGAGPHPGERRSHEQWRQWTCDGLMHSGRVIRSFGPDASQGYGALLDAVASAPVLFAITSYTLSPDRPASGGVRLVTPTAETAADAETFLADVPRAIRLAPPGGTQVPTLLGTIPLGRGVAA